MDGFGVCDVGGHEAGEVGMSRWHVIGGHGGGVTPEYRIKGRVDVQERGWGGKPGVVWDQVDTSMCGWWQVSEGGVD